ncbi:uncharacterized protein LOC112602184 [Melanaphis sacchari]|uniref:uncharacterized protein LOC112602184 n=1 Tax=Melanaphis sacchari TaxID=742174 RepID=UPI000DC14019|nr:uncharacterized protein LOC112602184 [Melanaphis sacchari]
MDPQLTKQLIRRRLILENSLENSINYENKINNIEISPILLTNSVPSSNIKHNFLEKIKKFESFGDNQTKRTHQKIVEKFRNNTEIVNKFNNLNKETASKRIQITNKLEFDSIESFYNNNNKKDNLNEKIKQFEISSLPKNKALKLSTRSVKEHLQTSNELIKSSKKKICSKSDYNNWKIDKNWNQSSIMIKIN